MRRDRSPLLRLADELVAEVHALLPDVKPFAPNMAKQLGRSADSVVCNVGEGYAAFQPGQKINAYDVASKEAGETAAGLDSLVSRGILPRARISRAKGVAETLIEKLTKTIITLRGRTRD